MSKMKMVEIDRDKLDAFLDGKKPFDVDESIGKAHGYMRLLRTRLRMSAPAYGLLCRLYGLEENALLPDPPAPEPPAAPAAPKNKRAGYWLDLADNETHVCLRLMYGDDEVHVARAKVKGGASAKELDFIQAISYAAHMLYKFAEQDDLEAG